MTSGFEESKIVGFDLSHSSTLAHVTESVFRVFIRVPRKWSV